MGFLPVLLLILLIYGVSSVRSIKTNPDKKAEAPPRPYAPPRAPAGTPSAERMLSRQMGGYPSPSSVPAPTSQPVAPLYQEGSSYPVDPGQDDADRHSHPSFAEGAPVETAKTETEGYATEGCPDIYDTRPEWVNTPAARHAAISRSTLMQGVIFSELLQRPKALRRR